MTDRDATSLSTSTYRCWSTARRMVSGGLQGLPNGAGAGVGGQPARIDSKNNS
jgi:hypothetical protein